MTSEQISKLYKAINNASVGVSIGKQLLEENYEPQLIEPYRQDFPRR